MKIAIVGSGVSGLVCAWLLRKDHDVVVYEADDRIGGHTHTHQLELDGQKVAVDTGFLVYNERTYPLFCGMLERLGVATQKSDMSFGVSDHITGTEWRGTSLASVFAQPSNALKVPFWQMLADIARFNRVCLRLLDDPPASSVTLEDVLAGHRWSDSFREWYLLPLGSSIWSAAPSTFTRIPAATFARFFERHGLLRLRDQPEWRTVTAGAQSYVDAIAGPLHREGRIRTGDAVEKLRRLPGEVEVVAGDGTSSYDHVIVAAHSDQALRLLADADRLERSVLGAIRYQANVATLHTDTSLMPRAKRAWASWNYLRTAGESDRATLTYHLNRLQGIDTPTQLFVTLNRSALIRPDKVLAQMEYSHPVLEPGAVGAQARHSDLNGRRRTWFCGAYWGYGFHEDGVRSAVEVCRSFGASL
ncbi:MAG TPA: FAD-dependent oxidoreductase [Acidimicrobiales bacterium]|nr:FAD-dependent oxidoreductase [Acidimicrobiales bacterium]